MRIFIKISHQNRLRNVLEYKLLDKKFKIFSIAKYSYKICQNSCAKYRFLITLPVNLECQTT